MASPVVAWTTRNTVNIVLGLLSAIALVVVNFDLGLSSEVSHTMQAAAMGLLLGLLTPGSPVGRVIDAIVLQQPLEEPEKTLADILEPEEPNARTRH